MSEVLHLAAAGAQAGSWLEIPVVLLAGTVLLGVFAQWLAWRMRLPSILLLLLFGILAGSITEILNPDDLMGDMLGPIISLSVAVILYEGGLTLRLTELRATVGQVVRNLVTIGTLITWAATTVAARWLLDLPMPLAVLLGAVLVVTGPTVIQPLLRHIRPSGSVGKVLKWEGIVIDPIGALLAVLVFEVVLSGQYRHAATHAGAAILKTLLAGGLCGIVGAAILVLFLHRYWVPDFLQNPLSLTLALSAYAVSNVFQEESGLFAVTLMGILVANQRWTEVLHIIEFKENIRVLLISTLFILLGARLDLDRMLALGPAEILFVLFLIVLVRPVSVALSTIGSELSARERVFLAWMAPRGIVAAAISSIFALRLEEAGFAQAHLLVTVTFAVILGTVAFYGITAPFVAIRLGIAESDPQGVLIVGADRFGRALGQVLQERGLPVLLVDTNRHNAVRARLEGLPIHHGNVLAEAFLGDVDLGGIGRLIAVTPSDFVNGLAAQRFARLFGSQNVFRLSPVSSSQDADVTEVAIVGRALFGEEVGHEVLEHLLDAGAEVKATPVTEEFSWEDFRSHYGEDALPLFVISANGRVRVSTVEDPIEPTPGETVISLAFGDESPTMEELKKEAENLGDSS